MSKSQKKLPHTRLSFATTQKMKDELDKLAIKMNIPTSELIRRYIEQGMNVDKTKDDIDFIRKQIREEIHIAMDGYMNRLIKLLIRIGTMTITMCFFTSKLLYVLIAKYKGEIDYDVMFHDAKKKSAAFLGVKDESIEEACKKILNDKEDVNGE